jgi:DNA-binding MarR family transcriptional regulator
MKKKVRRYFCKDIISFSEKELMILLYILSKKEYEIITQTKAANVVEESISTLNYHFKRLRKQGYINHMNYLTNKGKKLIRYLKKQDKILNKKLRAHNIQITLFLAKCPKNLNKIRSSIFTPFTNGRYNGLKAEIEGAKVMIYGPKKGVVTLQDIYGDDDEEIAATLIDSIAQIIQILETEFPGLKVNTYEPAKFHSMHVAVLDSIIAEKFILKNKRNYSNGRIAVDKSHGRYELEAEDAKTALEDIEILVKYEDLVRENERLRNKIKETESLLKKNGIDYEFNNEG